jgi:hypothetical protein
MSSHTVCCPHCHNVVVVCVAVKKDDGANAPRKTGKAIRAPGRVVTTTQAQVGQSLLRRAPQDETEPNVGGRPPSALKRVVAGVLVTE